MELFLFICALMVIAFICDKLCEPGIKKSQAEHSEELDRGMEQRHQERLTILKKDGEKGLEAHYEKLRLDERVEQEKKAIRRENIQTAIAVIFIIFLFLWIGGTYYF